MAAVQGMAALNDDNNLVREWETGLPSASDLTPLSHSLISRVLARAFCIPPSSIQPPSSFDVLHASRVTLQLLQQKSSPSFPFPSFDPYSSYEAGHVGAMGLGKGIDEDRGINDCLQRNRDDRGRRTMSFGNSPMTKTWDGLNSLERDGGGTEIGNGNCGSEFGQPYFWPAQGAVVSSIGQYGSLGNDQSGYAGLEAGSESVKGASLEKSRKLDTESEDVDSADGPDGNTARTLKRPRLVWTPQLHKRFVDAVGHLGIKNAVPKTIMQLMNVEGLTRENVASHLQKYRLYLKRMQGLSTEGPSASDPLFASAPLPPNLTPQFFSSHPHSRMENGVSVPPFPPAAGPIPRTQGTSTPGLIGPGSMATASVQHFGGFDHPYNSAITRTAPQRPLQLGDHRGVNVIAGQPSSGSPPKRILTLFPPSGH